MRRRKKKGALEEYESYNEFNLELNENTASAIKKFKGTDDLIVELGAGRASFSIELAKRYPNSKIIAIEYKEELLLYACKDARENGLKNIKFIRGYIEEILDWFGDNKTAKIYLNFSDPWPKARHAKKRLTHINYLNKYKELMETGANIELKTDQKNLYTYSLEQFHDANLKIEYKTENLGEKEQDNIMTDYEKKFRTLKNPIYKIIATYLGG